MSWVLIAVATVAVLLPFASSWTLPSTHRFLASPSLSRPHLRRPCPGVVPLRSTAESSPAAGVSTDDDGALWWESFTLEHAWVAEQTRPQFPILSRTVGDDKPLIYLDSAATSQKPSEVVDALRRYYDTMNSNVHRGAHFLSQAATTAYEDSRDAVAELIGAARREEVVFTSGATQGLNLLARSLGDGFLVPEDGAGPSEVVVTAMEHHSNIVPWQMLAERLGPERLVVKYAGLNADRTGLDADHLRSLVTPRTKVVSFVHVSNALGCINPVDDIVSHVRSNAHPDCAIVLDACQSVPHMAVDVGALGVDFLVGSAHKFCGPTGIGFLWGKYARLEALPPYQGGGEMIDTVTLGGSTYAPPPARFEAGTPPIAQAVGMGAAARYVQRVGMENIHAYEKELGQYLVRRMNEVPGVTAFGPPPGEPRAALVSFATEGVHASDLSTFLDMEGVAVRAGHHCCQPLHTELGVSHSARASLYFYNTKRDVDVFIEKLEQTMDFFANMGESGTDDDFGDMDGLFSFDDFP